MRRLNPAIINSGKQVPKSVGFSVNKLIGDGMTKRELRDADIDKRYVRRYQLFFYWSKRPQTFVGK